MAGEILFHLNMCFVTCIIVHWMLHFVHDHDHHREEELKKMTKEKGNG